MYTIMEDSYHRWTKTSKREIAEDNNQSMEEFTKHEKTWIVFPHLNLAFQHQWIQAPYCLIEWRQPDPQFSEEHALLHTGTKPEDTNGKHK